MASPFPGMDPYLEGIWGDVHIQLISTFRTLLTRLLAPRYITDLGSRVIVERLPDDDLDGRAIMPDVAVLQPEHAAPTTDAMPPGVTPPALRLKTPVELPTRLVTLYIYEAATMKLVTVIELLSPVNKRGEGRREYLQKRNEVLDSDAHLVEIDLLRAGRRMPFLGEVPDTPYLAMVSRAYARPNCEVWPIRLQDPLPVLPVPLLRPDPDVPLDLGVALRTTYEAARYDLRIDYSQPPPPPALSDEETAWLEAQSRQNNDQ
ncbi:MAG: hypothetical protein MAG451_02869 [Anaerolineales bacterium]|nr:hypothetical protein [Anaerolineales bacterium]